MNGISPLDRPNDDGGQSPPAVERKPRRCVNLSGFGALENGATFPLTILDLSYDGCKIEAPIAMLPGIAVNISVVRLGVLHGKVRWSAAGQAGLEFSSAAATKEDEKPRAHPRQAVTAEMILRRAGQNAYRVTVCDLTCKGCKIEFVERPIVGETVWAKFDGLESLEAKVRWIAGAWTGLEFERTLYPSVFELLMTRLGGSPA